MVVRRTAVLVAAVLAGCLSGCSAISSSTATTTVPLTSNDEAFGAAMANDYPAAGNLMLRTMVSDATGLCSALSQGQPVGTEVDNFSEPYRLRNVPAQYLSALLVEGPTYY